MKRRTAIQQMAMGAAGMAGAGALFSFNTACDTPSAVQASPKADYDSKMKGNINHSVCRWCYNGIPFEEFCERGKAIGLQSIELTGVNDWPVLRKYGLTCALGTFEHAKIPDAFNETKHHEHLQKVYIELIDAAADAGIPSVICFSGNRRGMDDMVGMDNCAVGLESVVKHAEKKGVLVIMELLNSKVNHKDYMCDHTDWGVKLAQKLGSPNFKLLYDIYHMQIMEGDVIATIRANKDFIGHYHTGGVPGRHEINAAQELNYPAIMKAILETGYL